MASAVYSGSPVCPIFCMPVATPAYWNWTFLFRIPLTISCFWRRLIDGKRVVLKLGVPCRELTTECAALNWCDGRGAVRLMEHDSARGMLLTQRLTPATPISELQDEREATSVAAKLMKKLWCVTPAEHLFHLSRIGSWRSRDCVITF